MTLTEARKILERNINLFNGELEDAVHTAISVLPIEIEYRPSVEERMEMMLDDFCSANGFNPFEDRRRGTNVLWRQCFFYALRRECYTYDEIGRATGYDHATVFWGARRIREGLEVRDRLTIEAWNKTRRAVYGD